MKEILYMNQLNNMSNNGIELEVIHKQRYKHLQYNSILQEMQIDTANNKVI